VPPEEQSAEFTNRIAYVGLCCGLASFVPWIMLVTFPCAILFCILGLVRAQRLPGRPGRQAAVFGIGMAFAGAGIQVAIASLASIIGWLG
jgi:hypothetical protein